MKKRFNVTATCLPNEHYMVDIKEKLDKIIDKIDLGLYFTINKARQYGKTTILSRLYNILKPKYIIIPGSLEGFSSSNYKNERTFSKALIKMIGKIVKFKDRKFAKSTNIDPNNRIPLEDRLKTIKSDINDKNLTNNKVQIKENDKLR
jgi:hypothetical protein